MKNQPSQSDRIRWIMNTRRWITLLAIGVLVLSSCDHKGNKNPETVADTLNAGFVPSPKKSEKLEVVRLALGAQAPGFNLPDTKGNYVSMDDFAESKVLVIIFTCNHCPTAQAYEDRLIQFTSDYTPKGVAVVAVMPNSVFGLLPEECGYSDLNDTYGEMKQRVRNKGFNFPYLYDGDD